MKLAGIYEWVLFDQGGTLFEPLPGHYSEFNQRLALRELGHVSLARHSQVGAVFRQARRDADRAFLARTSYTHRQLVTEHLLRGLVALEVCDARLIAAHAESGELPPPVDAVAAQYFARQRDAVVTQLRLKSGCHAMLEVLGREAKLAIVSNNAEAYLQPLVRRYRLDHWLHESLSSDALGACKPDPEIFVRAFSQLGIAPGQASKVLYVGDSVAFDVVGAKSAGLDVALVAPPDAESGGATYRVASLAELGRLFAR